MGGTTSTSSTFYDAKHISEPVRYKKFKEKYLSCYSLDKTKVECDKSAQCHYDTTKEMCEAMIHCRETKEIKTYFLVCSLS